MLSEDNTVEENIKIRNIRLNAYNNILKQQFQLSYYGRISYEATDNMTVMDRKNMYNILTEQKEAEKKAHEEAIKQAKAHTPKRRRR